jgi:hypothetical protein
MVEEYGEELAAFFVFSSLDPEDGKVGKLADCMASHTRM